MEDSDLSFEIYAFPHAQKEKKAGAWTKYAKIKNRQKALEKAEKLFQSCQFSKVQVEEIHRKKDNTRKHVKTLRTFQARHQNHLTLMGLFGLSAAILLWAFLMLLKSLFF